MAEPNRVMGSGQVIHTLLWVAYGLVCVLTVGVWIFYVLPKGAVGRETAFHALSAWTIGMLGTGVTALAALPQVSVVVSSAHPVRLFPVRDVVRLCLRQSNGG